MDHLTFTGRQKEYLKLPKNTAREGESDGGRDGLMGGVEGFDEGIY